VVINVIAMFGYKITKNKHYTRNKYNTNIPGTVTSAENRNWIKMAKKHSACHQFNCKGGKANLKYISQNGKKEAVYYGGGKDWKGKLNLTEEDKGTYNFGPRTGLKHAVLDVAPYVLWGNSKKD